ncbi:MAG: permease-like cell division protein FtsX [Gaiellaceae bacterium]|jgi:cell division transport system permease protein
MSRFKLLLSEALHSIRANLSTTVAATMTVFIGMFLLGICIALGSWMVSWSNHTKKEIVVHVYFCAAETCPAGPATEQEKGATLDRINQISAQGLIKKAVYVSKEEAYAEMKKTDLDLLRGLVTNPLPDAYYITPKHGEDAGKIAALLGNPKLPGVQKIDYGGKVTKRVLHVARVIEYSFVFMVLILLIASTALIANTIRLSIFSRRREIEVMKLVGATNWFVRGPFMVEGLICGFGGALLAVILLTVAKVAASSVLSHNFSGGSDVHAWPFALTSFLMLATGLVLGAIGTGITIRRYLQV